MRVSCPRACVCAAFYLLWGHLLLVSEPNIYLGVFSPTAFLLGAKKYRLWSEKDDLPHKNSGNFIIVLWNSSSKKLPVCVFRPLAMRKIWGMKNILECGFFQSEQLPRGNMYLIHKYASWSKIVYLITIDSIITGSPGDVDQNKQKRFFCCLQLIYWQ